VKLTPNIDHRGRRARLVGGIVIALLGVGLVIAGLYRDGRAMLIGGIVAVIVGGFMVFEAANGWCVLRAMGIKTPV
jgi:uncharacterized membrane protein